MRTQIYGFAASTLAGDALQGCCAPLTTIGEA